MQSRSLLTTITLATVAVLAGCSEAGGGAVSDVGLPPMVFDDAPPPPTVPGDEAPGATEQDPPADPGSGKGGGTGGTNEDPEGPDGTPPGGQPVPEPGTLFLLGTGLATAAGIHRRRRRQADKADA